MYKVLVVGDIGTGKTSLIKRYVHGIFNMVYKSTIGVDFALKVLEWDENTTIRLQLWDIAGQERFGNMTRVYYKEAVAAFVVFEVTRISTYEAAKKWKSDIDAKVVIPGTSEPIPVVLLANKIDLVSADKGWGKTNEDMNKFCEENGFVGWFETSAKNDVNIESASNELVKHILEKVMQVHESIDDPTKFKLDGTKKKENVAKCALCAD